ncbi:MULTISPECIES: cysteine desulfurase family protein [Sporosarcina]|uniref:cysteine desulfurase family protein n=1 Tax=Sporosarcina TaxID=1569 RepID=UPI00129B2D3F|nr:MULTISPECIES: cysteine desulfurase family protein [Sporosarcina]GKV66769.1 cysteine desulfurase [Sporosarcina sp. NCCP-2331]GLB57048.1 cysteine desulfurase [Sporosarcina sp. NCCP-2378]
MKEAIYLDYAATTPMHPAVLEKFTASLAETFGNPSSTHQFGRNSKKLLEESRSILAKSIGANPNEIIFTSGGTEADNLAIFGTVQAMKHKGNHIITTKIEHHAVLNPCKRLESQGFEVTYLEPDRFGMITAQQVQDALTDKTILVTIMYGNNEVGTILPIQEIGEILQSHQAVFHTDAVQAYGLSHINVDELKIDLLSVTAHKLNGPKGIGFLYQRNGTQLDSLSLGGGQEKKRRAGTENVPAAAAFAEAVTIAEQTKDEKSAAYISYKQTMLAIFGQNELAFEPTLSESVPQLPHVFHVSFPGTDVETFLMSLDIEGVAVSSGSACSAGSFEPSHVITAMFGNDSDRARNSIRISFGYGLDQSEIEEAAQRIAAVVKRLVK